MRNLLRASLNRTLKGKLFKIELAIVFLLAVFIIINGYFMTNITNAYVFKLAAQFFGHAPLIGFFVGVFSAKLWGQDYECGAMRSKLICGHRRNKIYLGYFLLTSIVGLAVAGLWLLLNLALGIPLFGLPLLTIGELTGYIVSDLLMVIALSAVCNLLASLADKESKGLLLCVIAVVAMIVIGLILHKRFSQEHYKGVLSYSDNPDVKYPMENSFYVGGTARILLELSICLLPGAQGVLLLEQHVEHMIFPALCSLLVTVLATLLGMYFFKKKDIK